MNADFAHLHVHTQYSLLDSCIRLDDLLESASADKMGAVAITDHGNLFGVLDFYLKAKEYGIKPILGCELYMAPTSRLQKGTHGSGDDELAPYATARSGLSHLILLCQNDVGYQNLCKLVSSGYLEGFYYKPRIDKELLAKHAEGLIATSSCFKGEVTAAALLGDMDRAREAAKWYRDIFQGRFYLELQNNGLPQQMVVNNRFLELGKELGIGVIATADCHYLKKEDAFSHEVLMAINKGHTLDDPSGHSIKSDEFYFKPQAVMKQQFSFAPEAIANTMEIAKQCTFDFKFTDEKGKKIYYYPNFVPPGGLGAVDYLNQLSAEGLRTRLTDTEVWHSKKFTEAERKDYDARLLRELGVINEMGFTGYFLIVADFILAAKRLGIPVGPGRGSGAGSLVAYSLGITDLDPIEHGLIFERFLNPERISLPDFDVDFCMDRRDEVIRYVSEKYGADCVAQIITFGKLQARGVIRDVGRAFGMAAVDVDKIAKLVPETLNITLEEALAQEARLRALIETDAKLARLFQICRQLEGLQRHASIHAAGLVISNRPMVEHCALYKGKNDELVIQFDMNNADRIGLIKFDFLGLKTLTFLQRAEVLVRQRHPEANFAINRIPLIDAPMYQMLAKGDTLGVFQLESSGMQDLMKRIRPDCFEDIVASNALYRPGPLESGMVDDYIGRKHGTVPVEYDFDQLKPVLGETYGVIVYQEQVQQIAMRLASYTAGGADLLRRAMGKKKPEEMAKQKEIFVAGGLKNQHPEPKLEKLFDLMAKFAGYGFNKSHAAAYSLITCQTAYLKCHYIVEFFAALLSIERENTDKITKYIADAKRHGIQVMPPDINESETDFTVLSEKHIRLGFGAVKGVGQIAIDAILEARRKAGPFKDLFDLCSRTSTRMVNKRVLEAFTKAGALDCFGIHRASLLKAIDSALEQGAAAQKGFDENQSSLMDLFGGDENVFDSRTIEYPDEPRWPRSIELKLEKETTGFYVSGHPLDDYKEEIQKYTTADSDDCHGARSSRDVLLGASVAGIREIFTKRGERMAFVVLEDLAGQIEAVVFSDIYQSCEELFKSDEPIWVKGLVEKGEGANKLILSSKNKAQVLPLRHAYEVLAREIHFSVKAKSLEPNPAPLQRLEDRLKALHDNQGLPLYFHVEFDDKVRTSLRLKTLLPARREALATIRDCFPPETLRVDFR